MILSAAMMLDHLGENEAAHRIRTAVREVLSAGESVTADIKRALTGSTEGSVGTRTYGAAVAARVAELASRQRGVSNIGVDLPKYVCAAGFRTRPFD